LLELSGYIRFTDEEETVSRIYITATRSQLYTSIQSDTEEIFNYILRRYTGIFQEFVYIDEEEISIKTGIPVKTIYEKLVALNQRHIIKYIPRKKIPYITLTQHRVEGKDLVIPRHAYEERYEREKARIESVISYINNTDTCRTSLLLEYFGENLKQRCNNCDYCDQYKPSTDKTDAYEEIWREIQAQLKGGPLYGYELDLSKYNALDIEHVIRVMSEEGEILQDGLRMKLKKTN
jgi:ATP-dependent DNA helicase RecQ